MVDVYKPPASNLENNVQPAEPDYKLYKISGIGIATFFGSLLAGGLLMSRNYKHLGDDQKARNALIYSFLATLGIFLVASLIPEDVHIPNLVFTIPQIIVMVQVAKSQQGQAIVDHTQRGGRLASNWLAFGISILVMLAIIAVIVPFVMMTTTVNVSGPINIQAN